MSTINITEEDIQTIGGLLFVSTIICDAVDKHPDAPGEVALPAEEVLDISALLMTFAIATCDQETMVKIGQYAENMKLHNEMMNAKETNQLQ